MVMFQILLDGAEPRDAGTTQLSSPVCRTMQGEKEISCIISCGWSSLNSVSLSAAALFE